LTRHTSVRFTAPAGMKVSWPVPRPDGRPGFIDAQVDVPGRHNFSQAAIYRLKLTDIANQPGLELYPTLEAVPGNDRPEAFLAHSSVPVTFTEDELERAAAGKSVVKVVYLPSPRTRDRAAADAAPGEVVSSHLEPGVDPISEAQRRGTILLVIRTAQRDG